MLKAQEEVVPKPKRAYIMQGASGSGKSTIANILHERALADGYTSKIHNTDSFFYDDMGNYNFDPSKLGEYHKKNYDSFIQSLLDGVDNVFVDNTNILAEHARPYLDAAKEHGYDPRVIRVDGFLDDILGKNVHDTPPENVKRMHSNMQDIIRTKK